MPKIFPRPADNAPTPKPSLSVLKEIVFAVCWFGGWIGPSTLERFKKVIPANAGMTGLFPFEDALARSTDVF